MAPFFITCIIPAFSATNMRPSGAVTTAVGRTNHQAINSVSKPGALAAKVSLQENPQNKREIRVSQRKYHLYICQSKENREFLCVIGI